MTIDSDGLLKIETNDSSLSSSTSLIVFKASLDNYPLVSTTANVYINIIAATEDVEIIQTETESFLSHMPNPFFSNYGTQMS